MQKVIITTAPQAQSTLKDYVVHLTENISYRPLTPDNYEEVVELFLDTYMENPGNPIWKALGVNRAQLESLWRPYIQHQLEFGFMDLIFYHKGRAAAFAFTEDLHDTCAAAPTHADPLLFWKQGLDKRLCDEARKHFSRGQFAVLTIGVNSRTGFEGMFSVMDKELVARASQYGFTWTGSHIYNPRTVSIVKRNGGHTICELAPESIEYKGRRYFVESAGKLVCCFGGAPIGEEAFKKHRPYLLPRYYELQRQFREASGASSAQAMPKL